jgi:NAD(P)H-dependent FMN reductase
MSDAPLQVLAVVGSLKQCSVTRVAIHHVAEALTKRGCSVDVLDLQKESLPVYNPDSCQQLKEYAPLQSRVDRADVILLGTPDYHGSISSAIKNFLDYFWHEFAGKLFATIVASHEKGLTATDQLRTIARQCYAWSLPYGISFTENIDVKDGQIASESLRARLAMLVRDIHIYGGLLARQRTNDLAATDGCFMARHRK